MRSAEKNDVDITKLFRYKTEVEVKDELTGDSGKFYLRIIADLNRARVFGLRKAAQLRKELKDPESEVREAFITEFADIMSAELLIESILILKTGEMQREIVNMTDVPEPRAPRSDATQEVQENFQLEVDEYDAKYRKEYRKNAKKVEKKERKNLEGLGEEALYVLYEGVVIDRMCTEEMTTKYYEMCVFIGTYSDPDYKHKAFSNFEQFDNAAPHLKDLLMEQYRYLELGMTELKKSPEATE
ncbi:MAG: hypothetical protein ACXABD_14415 [Candidatus Thorarchaeota archaeon]|jgi:hypothetical protein